MNRTACLLALSLFVSTPLAQSTLERARHEFEQAKRAKADKQTETAALYLRNAMRFAVEAGADGEKLAKDIDGYAKRIDPSHARRSKSMRRAADRLVKVARAYIKAGWLTTAEPLLRDADRIAPRTARPGLDALATAKRTGDASATAMAEMFAPGDYIWGEDAWVFDGPVMRSPEYDQGRQLRIGHRRLEFDGSDRSVEFEWKADGERDVRLVFAYRHIEKYAELRMHRSAAGSTDIEIRTIDGDKVETLQQRTVQLAQAELDGWLKVRLDTSTEQLRAVVGAHQPVKAKSPGGLRGFLGVMVVGHETGNSPVEFRNLRLGGFE